ncbi:MAG TPA: NAD(P)H-binding protein [Chitinophagaceae bacterium]
MDKYMTATIIGVTGLIGNYLLEELLKDDYYDAVRILVRRPYEFSHSKLEKKLVDFSDGDSVLVAMANSDVVFCAIGTTQQQVKGDKEAYRKVDYDIAVNAARFCKITGCEKFVLVSSVGANSKSNNFYLKLKGEIEEAVKAIGLKAVHIMRPSVLLGDRKEFRLIEKISKGLMKTLSFLIPSKYKPIHGKEVAKAMVKSSKDNKEGFFIYEYNTIKRLIQ